MLYVAGKLLQQSLIALTGLPYFTDLLSVTPPALLDSLLGVCLEKTKQPLRVFVLVLSYCRVGKKELNSTWSCSVSTGKQPSIYNFF